MTDPSHERAQNNKRYYEQTIEEEDKKRSNRGDNGEEVVDNELNEFDYRKSSEFHRYEALCRGEDVMVGIGDQRRAHSLVLQPCLTHYWSWIKPCQG